MTTTRNVVLAENEYYHVFNRGLDRRPTFTDKREYERAVNLIKFYRHKITPMRYSQLLDQEAKTRMVILEELFKSDRNVDIICYCLMPNHFHFLLKQLVENGVTKFISNFTNSYTRYFNTKNERAGALFQGIFKAVHIETDEQLIHLSRYIHLNPVVSEVIRGDRAEDYAWSSYREFLSLDNKGICEKDSILNFFKNPDNYNQFVLDQINYAKELEAIKHLALE